MQIKLKSKLYGFVALVLSCGALSATEQAVSEIVTQVEQQTEAAKKKAKELAAALQEQGQEGAALLSSEQKVEESVIAEAEVPAELPTVDAVR